MYITWLTRIISFVIVYVIQNWRYQESSIFYQRNGKLPLPWLKQVNYPVITIIAVQDIPESVLNED